MLPSAGSRCNQIFRSPAHPSTLSWVVAWQNWGCYWFWGSPKDMIGYQRWQFNHYPRPCWSSCPLPMLRSTLFLKVYTLIFSASSVFVNGLYATIFDSDAFSLNLSFRDSPLSASSEAVSVQATPEDRDHRDQKDVSSNHQWERGFSVSFIFYQAPLSVYR